MTDTDTINTHNVFDDESMMPIFPEVAYDLIEEMSGEAAITAVGFSSLLWEILTEEQRNKLTAWDRAALERLHDLADEVGLEEIGAALRS